MSRLSLCVPLCPGDIGGQILLGSALATLFRSRFLALGSNQRIVGSLVGFNGCDEQFRCCACCQHGSQDFRPDSH